MNTSRFFRRCYQFIAMLLVATCANSLSAADPIEGRATQVTLFRGQAQVTRTIPVTGAAGSAEIVVNNLPEQIVPNSLFAEGGDAVEIRAVRFRTRAVGEQPREEVRKLDEEILATQQQIDLAGKRVALLKQRSDYLNKLEGFVAPTAHSDLSKGVLNAESLEKISDFSFTERDKIATQEVELAKELHDLQEKFNLLQRKRQEITAGASRTEREAVLFVQKPGAGPADVRLNYLVNNCGWSPAYTIRATGDHKKTRVEYNALIHQLSGEDWTNVSLVLSTASPTLSAAGPGLAPFHVRLVSEDEATANAATPDQKGVNTNYLGRGISKGEVQQQLQTLNTRKSQSVRLGNNSTAFDEQNRFNWDLNDVAYGLQQLELNCDSTTLGVLRSEKPDDANGPSLSYQLDGAVSLASRDDQQMVRIMHTEMESEFHHVAVPVLSSYVYREADLTNSSDKDLLAGPITAYLDGRFVGRGEIPTVARGQTFVVGFGADPQLRARRELVDKQDGVQGGNRETRFEFRLVIENFAKDKLLVRLLDRLPHAEKEADIRVTLGEMSDPLSMDKLYQRDERPMGLLRWDIEVPAKAAGENARITKYKYVVEYDRQYVISLPDSKKTLQEEFERLQRERQKR